MKYDDAYVQTLLGLFNSNVSWSDEEARDNLAHGRNIGNTEFVEAVRKIIVDEVHTFVEKEARYVKQGFMNEAECHELFKRIWNIISEGQPWPLDEVPAAK